MTYMPKMLLCLLAFVMLEANVVAQNEFINCFAVNDEPSFHGKTLSLSVSFNADYDSLTTAIFTISAKKNNKSTLWISCKLEHDFSYNALIPNDLFEGGTLKGTIYNPKHERMAIDSVVFNCGLAEMPSFVPEIEVANYPHSVNILSQLKNAENLRVVYSKEQKALLLSDVANRILSKPLLIYFSGFIDGQYIENQSDEWKIKIEATTPEVTVVKVLNDSPFFKTELLLTFENGNPNVEIYLKSNVKKNLQIERLALVVPFRDDEFTVYDSYMHQRNANSESKIQNEYYLDHEGFSLKNNDKQLNVYHPEQLSSMQLDASKSIVFFNLDYEKDHPFVHFPLNNDTSDYFVDASMREALKGDTINASFVMSVTQLVDLPRIMPVWNGFESAIIFTEHADWTDIRTHRAVCFGSEDITCADSAVGGFVYYGIPVTKSVFYNNPDSVRNIGKNQEFPDLHSTIKTDSAFFDILKQLKTKDFDICLHTPEQYTTTPSNLSEALSFMREYFGSPSWIDHGYNNQLEHNREDIVCDGLDKSSPYYVCDLWRKNGVRYPWNAAYEELRPFDNWQIDCHLQRPYPFFSSAFPKPRVMRLPNEPDFLLWSTDYTTEPGDYWNYFFSEYRLMKVVESRSAMILHTYPAWVETFRGFWDIENGKAVAKPDFNEALARIAKLRDENLLLPTTIDKYMHYQELLQNIDYKYDNDGNVILKNNNDETIKGFSLISKTEIKVEGKQYSPRLSNGEYIVTFDFEPSEEVVIKPKP